MTCHSITCRTWKEYGRNWGKLISKGLYKKGKTSSWILSGRYNSFRHFNFVILPPIYWHILPGVFFSHSHNFPPSVDNLFSHIHWPVMTSISWASFYYYYNYVWSVIPFHYSDRSVRRPSSEENIWKEEETEEHFMPRGFVICTIRKILLGWANDNGWDVHSRQEKCIENFVRETGKNYTTYQL